MLEKNWERKTSQAARAVTSVRKGRNSDAAPNVLYVQNVRTQQFCKARDQWSNDIAEAQAFPTSHAALEFCNDLRELDPELQLIIHFGPNPGLPNFA